MWNVRFSQIKRTLSLWFYLLTDKNEFYSSLTGKGISDKEYPHFCKVWEKIERKTMIDYHDLYLICDVSLLNDILEKLRNRCL